MELNRRSLDPEDRLQVSGRRVFDDGVLDVVDLLVEIFDHLERLVDRQLEEPDQEMVGPLRAGDRGDRARCSGGPGRGSARGRYGR